jgi:tryptophan-rich sensory protein
MSWVYAILPAINLFLSGSEICRPQPFVYQPPGWIFGIVWTILSIVSGFSGYWIYLINDPITTSSFVLLCWFLGIGWAVSNKVCNQYITVLDVYTTLILSILLFIRLRYLATNANDKVRYWANLASWFILPLLIWLGFAQGLSLLAAYAKARVDLVNVKNV